MPYYFKWLKDTIRLKVVPFATGALVPVVLLIAIPEQDAIRNLSATNCNTNDDVGFNCKAEPHKCLN